VRELIRKILLEHQGISNFDKVIDSLGSSLKPEILNGIKEYVRNYVSSKGFNIKFLNSCSAGFSGVRTRNQIIICSPHLMTTLGDFIYTIFHEIRHEEQMTSLKMINPLTEMDLNDFEKLSEKYWEMEMDADRFAKEKVANLILKLKLPLGEAKPQFNLSQHIENYQYASNYVKSALKNIVNTIKNMKGKGLEFDDIQDLPMVKNQLDKLENFI